MDSIDAISMLELYFSQLLRLQELDGYQPDQFPCPMH